MHIGLIGGIGPAATQFYYRRLVDAHVSTNIPLELTIANAHMPTLIQNLERGEANEQARVYTHHLAQLAAAGAQAAAITSIAGHFCYSQTCTTSPLPLISALTALSKRLAEQGFQRIGLLGSGVAMTTAVYGSLDHLDLVLPQETARVGAAYMAMATARVASDQQRQLFFRTGEWMVKDQSAEVVVLVGTDLFLAFDGYTPDFPHIDSAQVHVDALSRLTLGA